MIPPPRDSLTQVTSNMGATSYVADMLGDERWIIVYVPCGYGRTDVIQAAKLTMWYEGSAGSHHRFSVWDGLTGFDTSASIRPWVLDIRDRLNELRPFKITKTPNNGAKWLKRYWWLEEDHFLLLKIIVPRVLDEYGFGQ